MKNRSRVGFVVALCLSGCFARAPVRRDATGRPEFEGYDFRHRQDTPFWCHTFIDARGRESSNCAEIEEWCASSLHKLAAEGHPVGACAPTDSVACLTFYRGDATKTFCYATAEHCSQAREFMRSEKYGASEEQLTVCTPLDRGFQPPP